MPTTKSKLGMLPKLLTYFTFTTLIVEFFLALYFNEVVLYLLGECEGETKQVTDFNITLSLIANMLFLMEVGFRNVWDAVDNIEKSHAYQAGCDGDLDGDSGKNVVNRALMLLSEKDQQAFKIIQPTFQYQVHKVFRLLTVIVAMANFSGSVALEFDEEAGFAENVSVAFISSLIALGFCVFSAYCTARSELVAENNLKTLQEFERLALLMENDALKSISGNVNTDTMQVENLSSIEVARQQAGADKFSKLYKLLHHVIETVEQQFKESDRTPFQRFATFFRRLSPAVSPFFSPRAMPRDSLVESGEPKFPAARLFSNPAAKRIVVEPTLTPRVHLEDQEENKPKDNGYDSKPSPPAVEPNPNSIVLPPVVVVPSM